MSPIVPVAKLKQPRRPSGVVPSIPVFVPVTLRELANSRESGADAVVMMHRLRRQLSTWPWVDRGGADAVPGVVGPGIYSLVYGGCLQRVVPRLTPLCRRPYDWGEREPMVWSRMHGAPPVDRGLARRDLAAVVSS